LIPRGAKNAAIFRTAGDFAGEPGGFDSAIPRFESWRPSQISVSGPVAFKDRLCALEKRKQFFRLARSEYQKRHMPPICYPYVRRLFMSRLLKRRGLHNWPFRASFATVGTD
jgi:hypothetical protein